VIWMALPTKTRRSSAHWLNWRRRHQARSRWCSRWRLPYYGPGAVSAVVHEATKRALRSSDPRMSCVASTGVNSPSVDAFGILMDVINVSWYPATLAPGLATSDAAADSTAVTVTGPAEPPNPRPASPPAHAVGGMTGTGHRGTSSSAPVAEPLPPAIVHGRLGRQPGAHRAPEPANRLRLATPRTAGSTPAARDHRDGGRPGGTLGWRRLSGQHRRIGPLARLLPAGLLPGRVELP
jgi:hypothetical protein